MIDALPGLIEVCLLVFCLIDCIQTEPLLVRNLPKIGWIVIIIILPIIGGIAWLVAGRPQQGATVGAAAPWRSTRTAGFPEYERPGGPSAPIDDVDERLRRDQERVDREHEEALRRWEASLRERERRLGPPPDSPN